MSDLNDDCRAQARQRLQALLRLQTLYIIVAALVVLVVLFLVLRPGQEPEPEKNIPEENVQVEELAPNRDLLASILESGSLADELIEKAQYNEDLFWITTHPEAYAVNGNAVQRKLLKLATTEPEAIPFVRAWLESYPSEVSEPCNDADSNGGVPRFYQWDPRWGYTVYSSTTFALTACGPTALAMVYQGLTGNNDLSPYDIAVRAKTPVT